MLKTAKIVGLNSDTEAALALVSYQPGSLVENTGNATTAIGFFVVVSCQLEDAFSRIRQALSEAEELFFQSSEPLPERLPEVLSGIKNSLKESLELQVITAATQEDNQKTVLYLLREGASLKSELYRGGKQSDLSLMTTESQLVSGLLEEGDRVLLTTPSLLELLGEENHLIQNFPIDEVGEEITNRLPQNQVYPVAGIILEKEPLAGKVDDLVVEKVGEMNIERERSIPTLVPRVSLLFSFLKSRWVRMGLIGLAAIILVIMLGRLILDKRNSGDDRLVNQYLEQATAAYNQSQALKTSDQQAARLSLQTAREALDKALKMRPGNSQALVLKSQLDQGQAEVQGIYQVDNFPLWLDLELAEKGFQAKNLSLSMGSLLVLNPLKKSLLEVSLVSKAYTVLAGSEQLGEAEIASINGEDRIWILSRDKGIVKVTEGEKATVEVQHDSEWGKIVDIYGFAGNIYLLDTDKNQIWKYIAITTGHSDKREYFNDGVKVDLSGAWRMQIDSAVWVLKKSGGILKFLQGNAEPFDVSGLDKALKDPQSFFVSDTTDNLYVLDSGNSRLVVLDKKGAYLAQYSSSKFAAFTDLVVDEKIKKAYFLEGSKIFQMELK